MKSCSIGISKSIINCQSVHMPPRVCTSVLFINVRRIEFQCFENFLRHFFARTSLILMTFAVVSKRSVSIDHMTWCVCHMTCHTQCVLSKMQYMFELTDKRPLYWGPLERNPLLSVHERKLNTHTHTHHRPHCQSI